MTMTTTEMLSEADLAFQIAAIAWDAGMDAVALAIESDARMLEKLATPDRKWVGRNGRKAR